MEPVNIIEGGVTALPNDDVDTDQIIPAKYLKRIERTGYGEFLFEEWRKKGLELEVNPVLVAGDNFGCGSSREHAVWAIQDYGFRAIIAPSFADIFFNNCLQNGVLPVVLPEATVNEILSRAKERPGYTLTVDLEKQSVSTVDGSQAMHFDIDPFRKYCLLNGLDEIGLSLRHADKIRAFEDRRKTQFPWYF